MNSNREEALFVLALEKPAEKRATFLDAMCDGDAALRQRLDALLSAHDQPEEVLGHNRRDEFHESPSVGQGLTELVPPPDEAVGMTLGRYKLREKLGEGGCGTVYVAEQTEPVRRRVALKVIKLGMDTREVIARFEAERQALAMMDHPNIAKVLDAGMTEGGARHSVRAGAEPSESGAQGTDAPYLSAGRPYFVMELVRGIKITDYCDQANLSTKDRLDLFIKVCQAIQHAHQKGIIHRDIKPGNILVTLHDGVPVPKVIDFGIAKATEGRLTDATVYTQLHHFMGTPAYMSPEQAEMSGLDIDTRSDIYSLGVLLYELLAGSTPFDAKELMASGIDAMRKTIREKEPQRPSTRLATLGADQLTTTAKRRSADTSKLLHQLKGDLDWIVMKCLEKDRQRRYDTANGLAADLKRHLENEPVVARPPSAAYKFQKAFRRNKLVFTAATAVAAALLVGISASVWQATQATRAKIQADASRQAAQASEQKAVEAQANEAQLRKQAEAARLISRRQAYASDMNALQSALASDNLGRARVVLNRHRPEPGEVDLRGWEWRYLWQLCQSDAQSTLKQPDGKYIRSVALSADARWAAVGDDENGRLSVYHLQTREIIRVPAGNGYVRVAFSPRELLLAIAIVEPRSPTEPLSVGDASPAHRVLLWDVNTRQVVRELTLAGFCNGLLFSEDGQTLVTGSGSAKRGVIGEVALWRVADGSKAAAWAAGLWSGSDLTAASWFAATRDASAAAVVTARNKLSVIDLKNGRERWSAVASGDTLRCLAFSADGRVLASGVGVADSVISLWDAETGKPLGRLEGQRGFTTGLVFLNDGKHLVSASADQTLRLWDLETHSVVRVFRGHKLEVHALALAADQRTLLSGGKDGSAYLWDLTAERSVTSSGTIGKGLEAWVFADGGNAIVTVGRDGHVVRRHGRTFQEETPLLDLGILSSKNILRSVLSPTRPLLAVVTAADKIQVWDWDRRARVQEWDGRTEAGLNFPALFSADGTKLFVIHSLMSANRSSLREWDLVTGRETRSLDLPETILRTRAYALSPDGTQWMGLRDGDAESWRLDLISGRVTPQNLNTPQPGASPALAPDAKFLAVPSMMSFVKIFDTATYRATATLSGFMFGVHSAGYSQDQQRLAIGSTAHEALTIWDVNNHERLLTLAAPVGMFERVQFSPDGNVIVGQDGSESTTGSPYFWRAPSWAEIQQAEAKEPPSSDFGGPRKTEGKQP